MSDKILKPTSLQDFKEMLSSDCLFYIEGIDGTFAVDHGKKSIEVSDIDSAPNYYCESFGSVDDMVDKMLVGKLWSDDGSGRVKVIDGVPLRECWQKATVKVV